MGPRAPGKPHGPGTFNPYIRSMPRKPIELPPGFARRFVDMRAYFAETNLIKRDEIAARQLHALRQHYAGKLRLTDVKETFLEDEGPSVMIVRSLRGGTSPKSRVANALARLAGIKGGRARAKKLSAEKRSEIAKKAATTRWVPSRSA